MADKTTVRVPGKINLQLSVGPLQKDGYHELATVFQSVSLYDEVSLKLIDGGEIKVNTEGKAGVPDGKENLAYQAIDLMRRKFEVKD